MDDDFVMTPRNHSRILSHNGVCVIVRLNGDQIVGATRLIPRYGITLLRVK